MTCGSFWSDVLLLPTLPHTHTPRALFTYHRAAPMQRHDIADGVVVHISTTDHGMSLDELGMQNREDWLWLKTMSLIPGGYSYGWQEISHPQTPNFIPISICCLVVDQALEHVRERAFLSMAFSHLLLLPTHPTVWTCRWAFFPLQRPSLCTFAPSCPWPHPHLPPACIHCKHQMFLWYSPNQG